MLGAIAVSPVLRLLKIKAGVPVLCALHKKLLFDVALLDGWIGGFCSHLLEADMG